MYTLLQKNRENRDLGSFLLKQIDKYLQPLLLALDDQIDKRLVRTFFDVFVSIIRFRNRPFGLVLSELGSYVLNPEHAPAGTKRVSNLLRSKKWSYSQIESFQLSKAKQRVESLSNQGKEVLFLWDDSVVEKAESWYSEGLCSVPSSKGKRLTKVKTGFYSPPKARICVPGFDWSAVVITTLNSVPSVCMMRWWTTRGKHLTDRKSVFLQMLKVVRQHFQQAIVHVLDRGYASIDIITRLVDYQQHFILRWDKRFNLCDELGKLQNAGKHASNLPVAASRLIVDKERKKTRRVTIAYLKVTLPKHSTPLTLVVCRDAKKSQEPMFLLTNCEVNTKAQAWKILFSYMRRWAIEQTFRFNKSELALESPRLWFWENRQKIMGIVSLVYDFLLQILKNWRSIVMIIINKWCPRTGKRQLDTQLPLYRFRIALEHLFANYVAQNSG
jgi:hypothetical protein